MPRYVAFLRALNVGGNNIVKMEDLKAMFVAMKMKNVVTYIQSGNVIFDSTETDEEKLTAKIDKHLQKSIGYQVDVFLRSLTAIEAIIKTAPFKKAIPGPETRTNVSFLSGKPDKDQVKQFVALSNEIDTFFINDRELYIITYKDKGKSILTDGLIKKHLKLKATTRNWNTVNKVATL